MLWKDSKQFGNPLSTNFQMDKASNYWTSLYAIQEREMIDDVVILLLKTGGHLHRFGHRPFCMRQVLTYHPGLLPIDQRGTAVLKTKLGEHSELISRPAGPYSNAFPIDGSI